MITNKSHMTQIFTLFNLGIICKSGAWGINQVELDDETKRLSDVRPFQPMLKLIEKTNLATGARAEKVIQAQLSVLLGKREL